MVVGCLKSLTPMPLLWGSARLVFARINSDGVRPRGLDLLEWLSPLPACFVCAFSLLFVVCCLLFNVLFFVFRCLFFVYCFVFVLSLFCFCFVLLLSLFYLFFYFFASARLAAASGSDAHTGLLYSHPLAQKHLAPSLLLLYGDVEHTG